MSMMEKQDLELQNNEFNIALLLAIAAGNIICVDTMLKKNNSLLFIPSFRGRLALYVGVLHRRYNIVKYLYNASPKLMDGGWTHKNRAWIFSECLVCELFDVAQQIVFQNYIEKESDALKLLRLHWTNTIRTKSKDRVDRILKGSVDYKDGAEYYSSGMLFLDAEMGNTRFVVDLLRIYPDLIWKTNDINHSIFHIAVMNRRPGIYNLLHEIGSMKDKIIDLYDIDNNNMLHLVGMTSVKMLSQMSGASLLMQRELLWFMEVEKIPHTSTKMRNKHGQTPYELFGENNKELITQGLK